MIRPPFTVLVVKEGHQPLTLRITRRLVLTGMLLFLVLTGIAVYGVYRHIEKLPASAYQPNLSDTYDEPAYTLNETNIQEMDEAVGNQANAPVIDALTVDQSAEESAEIGFTIANPPAGKDLFVWVIINPGPSSDKEMVIHPRSPVFRGMPVDYRNGIRFSGRQQRIQAAFENMKIGIDFDSFRILVYDPEDVVVIDKTYSIQRPDGK